jgi:hypothetical protein
MKDRRALKARCGARAFLDPKNLKFPVMAKSGACIVSCAGLRAAFSRARQYHHPRVASAAKKKATRATCAWT